MRFFLDTEFHERFTNPLIGRKEHTIDLISIGIVAENGRWFYALSKDFNLNRAWADKWIRENVLRKIFDEYTSTKTVSREFDPYLEFTKSNFRYVRKHIGYTNAQIAEKIKCFIPGCYNQCFAHKSNVEFYAYYADYDWVVFCSLFGRMVDLPKYFPMYCRDLKQTMDELVLDWMRFAKLSNSKDLPKPERTFNETLEYLKGFVGYPDNSNAHNALDDARFNMNLHSFLEHEKKKIHEMIEDVRITRQIGN